MKTLFKTPFKIVMVSILLLAITPILYFAWHMGHRGITIGILALQSGTYMIAGLRGVPPKPNYPFPESVTLGNFMSRWWDTYEYLFWYNEIHLDSLGSGPPSSICIINSGLPTPEEFEAMKLEHAANISASQ